MMPVVRGAGTIAVRNPEISVEERDPMPEIIPRWEWRTFGHAFDGADATVATLVAGDAAESDELYLLSGAGDNVKVRDDLMDIKVLQETNADGLEQWKPVMKAGFPLPAAEVTRVFEALRLPVPALARDAYTLDQFVDELARPAGVRPVQVHKRRARFSTGGCIGELSEVVADGTPITTIAVETTDPAAVIGVVRELGLGDYVNTSYPRALQRLLAGTPDRYAVIDVGTNSVKFIVAERGDDGSWRSLVDRAELTRLGEGLQEHGDIQPQPLERTIDAIGGMVAEARDHGVHAIAAVGTAGLRMARNSEACVAAIQARTGITVRPISGDEEGRLAYLAVKAGLGLGDRPVVVFDTGGGSTQFTFGHGETVDDRFSLDVGAVRFTERYRLDGVVSGEVLREALAAIAADFSRIDGRPSPDTVVGMGGAVTNITAVKHGLATYDPDRVQGTVLDRAEIDRQIELYRSRDADGRRTIVGLQPKRAEVILAGACIVRTVLDKLGADSLTVSDRALRHGLLVSRFG
jgi:exopolyphosphatase/guanosine-5'-triphosphate,3'-diphosphate pyrophosphatase